MGVTQDQLANGSKKLGCSRTWQYAPKLDPFGLRIAYLKEECFKVGTLVENVNTGVRGRIIREVRIMLSYKLQSLPCLNHG